MQMQNEKPNSAATGIASPENLTDTTRDHSPDDKIQADLLSVFRSPELSYLNEHHAFSLQQKFSGAAAGIKARICRWLLGGYFASEQAYNAQLVRHLNEISGRLERALIRLEDRREGSVYAVERRASAAVDALRAEVNTDAGTRARENADTRQRLETVESVALGLERIVSKITAKAQASADASSATDAKAAQPVDYSYLMLENRFRGSEAEIASRLSIYPAVFQGASAPVFEMGAGRGELQQLFKSAGIASFGCDQDSAMLEHCASLGLDVRSGDGLTLLRAVPDASLGGFIAVQVVEHLPIEVVNELFELLRRKLQPGSRLALETINSESMVALTRNYFRDPTHTAPLHPDTLRFLAERAGLKVQEIRKLSPYPEGAILQTLDTDEFLPPRMRTVIESLNHNVGVLNGLLFGFQDYCLIAEVPAGA